MRTLIDENSLQTRISELALEIDSYYMGQYWHKTTKDPVVIVGVLTGAMFFMADLARQLKIRVDLDFMRVSTYPGRTVVVNEPVIVTPPTRNLRDAHVLIIDDILDTGKTLNIIQAYLAVSYPKSVQTAVLLRKPGQVMDDVKAEFVGFDIPDEFVIGYGLDYNGRYRELPHVAVWSEDELRASEKEVVGHK